MENINKGMPVPSVRPATSAEEDPRTQRRGFMRWLANAPTSLTSQPVQQATPTMLSSPSPIITLEMKKNELQLLFSGDITTNQSFSRTLKSIIKNDEIKNVLPPGEIRVSKVFADKIYEEIESSFLNAQIRFDDLKLIFECLVQPLLNFSAPCLFSSEMYYSLSNFLKRGGPKASETGQSGTFFERVNRFYGYYMNAKREHVARLIFQERPQPLRSLPDVQPKVVYEIPEIKKPTQQFARKLNGLCDELVRENAEISLLLTARAKNDETRGKIYGKLENLKNLIKEITSCYLAIFTYVQKTYGKDERLIKNIGQLYSKSEYQRTYQDYGLVINVPYIYKERVAMFSGGKCNLIDMLAKVGCEVDLIKSIDNTDETIKKLYFM